MDIVYVAEKPSIAKLLSDHLEQPIVPRDIDVADNPDETGSFLVRWELEAFVVTPCGEVLPDGCED